MHEPRCINPDPFSWESNTIAITPLCHYTIVPAQPTTRRLFWPLIGPPSIPSQKGTGLEGRAGYQLPEGGRFYPRLRLASVPRQITSLSATDKLADRQTDRQTDRSVMIHRPCWETYPEVVHVIVLQGAGGGRGGRQRLVGGVGLQQDVACTEAQPQLRLVDGGQLAAAQKAVTNVPELHVDGHRRGAAEVRSVRIPQFLKKSGLD